MSLMMTDKRRAFLARKAGKEGPYRKGRQSFREHADRVNPDKRVEVLDSRGRPRVHAKSHHQIVG